MDNYLITLGSGQRIGIIACYYEKDGDYFLFYDDLGLTVLSIYMPLSINLDGAVIEVENDK